MARAVHAEFAPGVSGKRAVKQPEGTAAGQGLQDVGTARCISANEGPRWDTRRPLFAEPCPKSDEYILRAGPPAIPKPTTPSTRSRR